MRILVVVSNYPHAGHAFSGAFNERSAVVLRQLGHDITVLAPRPFAPRYAGILFSRWRAYAGIPPRENRDGIRILRPAYVQVPGVNGSLCFATGAYVASRQLMRRWHREFPFDAILAFGVANAGRLASMIARDLDVVGAGWATGTDLRVSPHTRDGRAVGRTLKSLDIAFYQSRELADRGAALLEAVKATAPRDRHLVLPRGVPAPPALAYREIRKRIRSEWNLADDDVLVLSIGRVVKEKGILELSAAMSIAAAEHPRLVCHVIGVMPGFDDTTSIARYIEGSPARGRVQLFPACTPPRVWEYLAAADIFAFASHREGMPNSLLEAMSMRLPVVAFGIPAVVEIAGNTGALVAIPPFDVSAFARAVGRLALSPKARAQLGELGHRRVVESFSIERGMRRAADEISKVVTTRRHACESASAPVRAATDG